MNDPLILVLDAGTVAARASLVSCRGELRLVEQGALSYEQDVENPLRRQFDPQQQAALLGRMAARVLSRLRPAEHPLVAAVAVSVLSAVTGVVEVSTTLLVPTVPLITVIALSYANLLEGSVLTETVFAWPGLGQYLTNSLQNADMNAVLGGTLVIGAVFIALNILSDLLYRQLDPRVRIRK